ncbi:MAG: LpxA family transferase [Chlamydiales bacterium]
MAITRISDYLLSYCLGKISGVVEPGVFLPDPEQIVIGKGTIVESGAYIKGPCIIGENCVIRHGAYLRGGVITGNDCLIGHGTEVKHSIFLNGAKAGHFAYVGDSILGNRVNLGAGTKLANLRFDKKNIFIKDGEKKVDSGLRKLGAILGDGSQTGCNAVTRPGVLIEPKSIFHPSTFLSSRIS